MQTPFPPHTDPSTLFRLERRRQRMREFLAAFDRHSWRVTPELPFAIAANENEAPTPSLSDAGPFRQ